MCPCHIHNSQRRKSYHAERLCKFILLIGISLLASDYAIQLPLHWRHDFAAIGVLTKAMADDDESESESESSSESESEPSGGSEGGSSSEGGGGSSGRSESSGESEHGDSGKSRETSRGRRDDSESERREDNENDEDEDEDDNEDDDGEEDDDDDDDEYKLEDGALKNLGKLLKNLTEPSKSKSRSRGHGRNFHAPRARNEILAINLDRGGAKGARKLGFKVGGSSQFSHLPGNVTRLVPPGNLTGPEARDLLTRTQPNGKFSVNQHYRFYQPARMEGSKQDSKTEPAQHGPGTVCSAAKCFGPQLIRWRDETRSCARGLRVGIIDTPVDHQHTAFSGADLHLGGFLPDGAKPAPAWHGTGVLSVLAGDRESGTPGLIPQATFYAASVFYQEEEGVVETDTVSILNALDWMSAFDVKIINMSFSGPKDDLIEEAIEQMSQEGVIFVAAAGNDGPTAEPTYPASYPAVIAVTAVSKDLRNYPYANRGDSLDASAPGVDIWSAVPDNREGFHTGTSFAAPHVTAMLALIYQGAEHFGNKDELLGRLPVFDLGAPGRDPIYGRGLMLAPENCEAGDGGWAAQTAPSESDRIQVTASRSATGSDYIMPSAGDLSFR